LVFRNTSVPEVKFDKFVCFVSFCLFYVHMARMVKIVLKNPSRNATDFLVDIPLLWSIAELKQDLFAKYPSNPVPEAQKLIFAGKLLKDDVLLQDLLVEVDLNCTQTFHLVLAPNVSNLPPVVNSSSPSPSFGIPPARTLANNRFNFALPLNNQQFNQFQLPQPGILPGRQPMNNNLVPPPVNNDIQRGDGGSPLWLLAKLGFLVYVLSQGGGNVRLAFLLLGALIVFLYQIGIIKVIAFTPNTPRQGPPQALVHGANELENNQDHVPQQPEIQNRGGFIGEITGLVFPFFYSLFPTWQPNEFV